MEREHKYRAWIIKENRYMDIIGFHIFDNGVTLWFIDNEDGPINYQNYHVDAVILEQYIGLKDKNAVLVYENDILKDGRGGNGAVVYNENMACFFLFADNDYFHLNEGKLNRPKQLQYTEKIGNIHENPELLS